MQVSLVKGERISLTKIAGAAGLARVHVGLGWNASSVPGKTFDADASAFLLNAEGKLSDGKNFVYYHNKKSPCGAVELLGDNLTGDGDGDDEIIKIDLTKLKPEIVKIVIAVSIHDAANRRQNFGQISEAYVRLLNEADNALLGRYDLTEDASTHTAFVFAEIYKYEGEWRMSAVGEGFKGGLSEVCAKYGLNAS